MVVVDVNLSAVLVAEIIATDGTQPVLLFHLGVILVKRNAATT